MTQVSAQVSTVRGPIEASELGTVLAHEHVFVLNEEIRQNYPQLWDEEAQVANAIARLTELKERGVDTIFDPTVIGLGRDIHRVARINAQVDLNIVPATGLYTYDDVPLFFRMQGPGTMLGGPEQMVDLFVGDLERGIAGTDIKAAFLKCAIEEELTPGVERVLRAVAAAHQRTGAPIMVHTSPAHRTGLDAQRVLREEGVDLSLVMIAHSGDTTDLDYLHELIDAGSILGMDRFGLEILLPTDDRVATIAKLAAEGLADRMVLAQDASCHIDWFPPGLVETMSPNWRFTFIHDQVIPALRQAGVTDEQLTAMLVDTPRRFITSQMPA